MRRKILLTALFLATLMIISPFLQTVQALNPVIGNCEIGVWQIEEYGDEVDGMLGWAKLQYMEWDCDAEDNPRWWTTLIISDYAEENLVEVNLNVERYLIPYYGYGYIWWAGFSVKEDDVWERLDTYYLNYFSFGDTAELVVGKNYGTNTWEAWVYWGGWHQIGTDYTFDDSWNGDKQRSGLEILYPADYNGELSRITSINCKLGMGDWYEWEYYNTYDRFSNSGTYNVAVDDYAVSSWRSIYD